MDLEMEIMAKFPDDMKLSPGQIRVRIIDILDKIRERSNQLE